VSSINNRPHLHTVSSRSMSNPVYWYTRPDMLRPAAMTMMSCYKLCFICILPSQG